MNRLIKTAEVENLTLKQLAERSAAAGVHRSWWYSEVRQHSRKIGRPLYPRCKVCGYDKHVEICHIKAIADFPPEAKLKEVNDLTNLIGLCPNHHWELDHELLVLPPGVEPGPGR